MDDLISRYAAIDAVEGAKTAMSVDGEIYCAKINAQMNIQLLPSAQPQRMMGRWIESNLVPSRKGKPGGRLFICSECNKGWVKQDRSMKGINFCPNCGADMRESINV